jgi:uncharacterized membrane protein
MRVTRAKFAILIAMSVVGLLSAAEVLFTYYLAKQSLPFCSTGGSFFGATIDCNLVLGSKYSQIFGIPLELFAVAYFIINLILVYIVSFGRESIFERAMGILFAWRFVGLMIVPYLIFIEFVVLRAVCVYCTTMHVAIVADFIVISYFLFFGKNALWGKDDSDGTIVEVSSDPMVGLTKPT